MSSSLASAQRVREALLSPAVVLSAAVVILLVFCVYPFANLIYTCFFAGPDGSFTLEYAQKVAESKSSLRALKNTVWISAACAFLSVVIAVPLAWLLTRTNVPQASRLRSFFCLPYAIPPYIGAIAWIYLANPTNGLLNIFTAQPIFNIYTFPGLIWVMSSFFYTFVLLSLMSAMDRMDSSLEEAARLSGAGPFRVFKDVTLPLVTPALLSGALLVFLASAASFGVPAMIGNPARIYLITTKIYTYQKMGSMGGIYQAGILSMILLVLAVVTLWVNQWLSNRMRFQSVSGKAARPSLVDLGAFRLPLTLAMWFAWGVLFVVPMSGILITALSQVQGKLAWSNFGLENFHRVLFEMHEVGRAFWNSLYLGVVSASIATGLGLVLAYLQWKTRIKGRHWIDVIASVPYATPGTVVALALILAFSTPFLGIFPSLYNTLGILALAYMVKYLSFAIRTTGDGFSQIDDCLAEAARVSGASWSKTLTSIWFPLMKPSMVAAWFLIFMPAVSELTMTILLTGPGIETVGTMLFQLQEYSDASGGGAAVLALIVVLLVAGINILVKILSKGRYGL